MKWGQIYLSSNKNHWTKWSLHFPYVNLISNAILYVTYEFSIQEEHDKRLSPSCINHAFTFPFHNSISIMMIKQTIRKWSKLWSICWKDALKIYYLREISLMIQDERGRSSFRLIYFLSLLVSNTRGTAKTA